MFPSFCIAKASRRPRAGNTRHQLCSSPPPKWCIRKGWSLARCSSTCEVTPQESSVNLKVFESYFVEKVNSYLLKTAEAIPFFELYFFMLVSQLNTWLKNCLTVNQAKQIHAQILVNNLCSLEPRLVCQLVFSAFNFSPAVFQYVQGILWHLQKPDSFSWSCTIRYFSQHGQFKEAFILYAQMQRWGLCPSTFSISSALRACGRIGYKIGGISIHAQVNKYESCHNVYVQTALLDFYAKIGTVENAQRIFDEMDERNVVTWNSMLDGYLKYGDLALARQLFNEMPVKDIVSWNSMISGYARSRDMHRACSLFQQMPDKNLASWNAMISGFVDNGKIDLAQCYFDTMPQRNNISWITMISGYSKCGDVDSARNLFSLMQEKDQLAFNSMITCYAQNSRPKEAIQLFDEMLKANFNAQPDKMTFASVISSCSQLGDLRFGPWIESCVSRLGIEMDDHLVTALIDFYAKSGSVDKAYVLFHGLYKKDLVAYSAMILGFGLNGKVSAASELFEEMLGAQICPNSVTFTGILTAYNHAGLVEEGYQCFNSMKKYGLMPSTDHYGIMVDLLGRAGRLEEAYDLIASMPVKPHAGVWGALLLACRLHDNVKLGEVAARHCFNLEHDKTGYSSILANIYASNERWDDAKSLRKSVKHEGSAKMPGCSWIESG
ncbi:hypothetical protein Nepgr_011324 [Nepenthes gracilis]|uniref:Pentatricopeptide repeat-containing protein n=1 Tax=Nepenthes gracilis TaxID=150966 RepID=A0AAD3SE00_NEPGR|nr:hypothetical protein Nepgr_011324 [Nepenthes gracilis]